MYAIMLMEIVMLSFVVYVLFELISMREENNESMVSPYECGFDSMMESRVDFSYRFFLISILFLVFDVEVTLLLPMPFIEVGFVEIVCGVVFVVVLLWGLLYEYFNGVLVWTISFPKS